MRRLRIFISRSVDASDDALPVFAASVWMTNRQFVHGAGFRSWQAGLTRCPAWALRMVDQRQCQRLRVTARCLCMSGRVRPECDTDAVDN